MNMILEAKADIVNKETGEKRFCKGKKYTAKPLYYLYYRPKRDNAYYVALFDEQNHRRIISFESPIMNNFVAHWNNK